MPTNRTFNVMCVCAHSDGSTKMDTRHFTAPKACMRINKICICCKDLAEREGESSRKLHKCDHLWVGNMSTVKQSENVSKQNKNSSKILLLNFFSSSVWPWQLDVSAINRNKCSLRPERFNSTISHGWWNECTIKCWTHLAQCQIFHFQFESARTQRTLAHTRSFTWRSVKIVHRTVYVDVGFLFYFFWFAFALVLMSMLNSWTRYSCRWVFVGSWN